jgi:hypothetical protein
MDITDAGRRWRLEHRQVTNLKTGEVRRLKSTPSANAVAYMTESQFVRKCAEAFQSGDWPY